MRLVTMATPQCLVVRSWLSVIRAFQTCAPFKAGRLLRRAAAVQGTWSKCEKYKTVGSELRRSYTDHNMLRSFSNTLQRKRLRDLLRIHILTHLAQSLGQALAFLSGWVLACRRRCTVCELHFRFLHPRWLAFSGPQARTRHSAAQLLVSQEGVRSTLMIPRERKKRKRERERGKSLPTGCSEFLQLLEQPLTSIRVPVSYTACALNNHAWAECKGAGSIQHLFLRRACSAHVLVPAPNTESQNSRRL